jgi:hypothetical protein
LQNDHDAALANLSKCQKELKESKERIDYWTKANDSIRESGRQQAVQLQEFKVEAESLKRQLHD